MSITLNGIEVEPLVEACESFEFLKEGMDELGKPCWYFHGIFLQADIKNRNGRIYPVEVMKKEVERYVREMVETQRAVGELGHPDGITINPERVSHKIVSLSDDGSGRNFIGKAKVLSTPFGKIVSNFLEEGVVFGVSSRAIGSLRRVNGVDQVQNDFFLATAADVVMDPSAPAAFVRGIMENKDYILADGLIQEAKIDEWKGEIRKASANRLQEVRLATYKDFLTELDCRFKF